MALTPGEARAHARALARARLERGQAAADRRGEKQPRGRYYPDRPNGGTYGNPRAIRPEHVEGVRHVLRAHGYEVDAHGPLTDRLLSAWRNYRRGIKYGTGGGRGTGDNSQPGAHTVKEWNQINPRKLGAKSAALNTVMKSKPAKGDNLHGVGDAAAKAGQRTETHAKAKAHADHLGVKGHKGTQSVPGAPVFGTDVNKLLPTSLAKKLASQQFDPQIQAAKDAIAGHGRDAAQAEADIGNWYGDVDKSLATATSQDAAAGHTAREDAAAAIQGIVNSLGGRGAGLVGAAGANDLTALAAQGQSQDQYNAELAPILKSEQAGAASRQQALASQQAMKLQDDLSNVLGQKGSAQTQALMQILGTNNSARQQNFANKLSVQNAVLAAQSLGLDAAKTKAMIQQYGVANAINKAKLTSAQKANKNATGWGALNATDRATLIGRAVQAGVQAIPGGAPWDPGHVQNVALSYLRTYGGLGSARKLGFKGKVPSKGNQSQIVNALNLAIQNAGAKYGQPGQ